MTFIHTQSINSVAIPLQPGEKLQAIWQEDPMRIVVLLYDRALLHIGRARSSLSGWGDDHYQTHLIKATEVVERLRLTLNTSESTPVAHNLDDLYRYIGRRLLSACHDKTAGILDEIMHLLVEIRSMLDIVVKKTPQLLQH